MHGLCDVCFRQGHRSCDAHKDKDKGKGKGKKGEKGKNKNGKGKGKKGDEQPAIR